MSNLNDSNKKSFSSMFTNKQAGTTPQTGATSSNASSSTQQASRGSFFNKFVATNETQKPASTPIFSKSTEQSKPTSLFSKPQDAVSSLSKTQSTSPLRKNSVEIPFDISKLSLDEKIAILEKINAEIEVETKNDKRMQPTARLTTPLSTSAQINQTSKPTTASQLFRSATQQAPARQPVKSLFGAKSTEQATSSVARPSIVRRPTTPEVGSSDIKISNEEFVILRDFLYEQCGIFVGENRKYLMENRLNGRLRELGLHNFSEYYNYLKYDKNRLAELNHLFINMTTNETSFFRNNVQLDIFRDKVLAKVIAEQRAKGEKKIHIWSAGCSSGEEPYTIAIIILELLKGEINDWNIKITANDLSPAMLAIARKGVYSEYALRTTPPEIVEKYFIKEGKQYKIIPAAQRLVQFGQINLARSEQLAKVERSHIVFCRNVIIYFDDAMKKHVINAFYDNLLPGGYLLIGHSESLHNISRTFKPEHHPGAIIYCKQS